MSGTKKFFLYFIFVAAATLFFFYHLFPTEAAKKYLGFQVSRIHPGLSLTVDDVKPTFAFGIRCDGATLYHFDDSLFDAARVTIAFQPLSFFKPYRTISFFGDAYEGKINGSIDVSKKPSDRQIVINGTLSAIQIKDIKGLQKLIDRGIIGVLNGEMTYRGEGLSGKGSAKFTLSDCKLAVVFPFVNLDQFVFGNIDADLGIVNRRVEIKKCLFKGQQMDGMISGTVSLGNPIEKSTLNLTGIIKPHPFFLADLKKKVPPELLPRKRSGSSGFRIRLKGTFDDPGFELR
jgi:type II secretion system protein N